MSDVFDQIREASEQGQPFAAAYTAVLAALGQGEPQSWPVALQRLVRAARLGSQPAQGQLEVLSGTSAGPGASWLEMAASIDLKPWLAPASLQPLSFDPRIAAVPGLVPPAACRWLIARAEGRTTPARIYRSDGSASEDDARNNSNFDFVMGELDLIVLLVRARIAATLYVPVDRLEPLQMLHYAPGQMFEPHCDFLAPASPELAAEMERAGQRVATFLIYLNDGYEGGETDFPMLSIRYKGAPGDALMFANVGANGQGDPRTLHAGLPPANGEKWLCTQWIRER